jgi:hypothetical protein
MSNAHVSFRLLHSLPVPRPFWTGTLVVASCRMSVPPHLIAYSSIFSHDVVTNPSYEVSNVEAVRIAAARGIPRISLSL